MLAAMERKVNLVIDVTGSLHQNATLVWEKCFEPWIKQGNVEKTIRNSTIV